MLKYLLLFVAVLPSSAAFANFIAPSRSAVRAPDEHYLDAAKRSRPVEGFLTDVIPYPVPAPAISAYELRKPFEKILLNRVPSFGGWESIQSVFEKVRDERFLYDESRPDFPRRISWLYPDDGCFARADLMASKLRSWGFPTPAKIFAFGNLGVRTPNSPSGAVYWWYHVVVGYRIGNAIHVFDPSIDAKKPLLIQDWVRLMRQGTEKVELTICDSGATEPYDRCQGATPVSLDQAKANESVYLDSEWSRMEELGRTPETVLGHFPPWRSNFSAFSGLRR